MANLKEIRNRISSVKNTRKITQAMSRIAAARLARAQGAMAAARPYGERLYGIVGELVAELEDADHELLINRELKKVGVVVLSADRGLCGGFNANVSKAALKLIKGHKEEGVEVHLTACGRKASQFLGHRGHKTDVMHPAAEFQSALELAHEVAVEVSTMFKPHDPEVTGHPMLDRVYVVYNHFRNVLTQEPTVLQVLPVKPMDPEEIPTHEAQRTFEPGKVELLDHLLPVAVESSIQQAMFNSAAAEVAARRSAMDSATDNASGLIDELTLEYNRERQAAITSELMEIISGSEALK